MKKKVKYPREMKAALALIICIHLKSKYLTGNFVDKNSTISMSALCMIFVTRD